MKPWKIAVVTTHPIQYHAPWFRASAACRDFDFQVLFCHRAKASEQANAGFGVAFDWDIPLLEGYRYRFLSNVASQPSVAGFYGLDTPEIYEIITAGHFDGIIVNGWHYKSAWQAIGACWATQTPVMVRSDSHLHSPRHPVKLFVKSAPYRWFIPRFDACLAVGKWSAEYFCHYGARQENVYFVPHVVDADRLSSECAKLSPSREGLRGSWNLGQADTVFLFAGKFIHKKRPMDFVRAIDLAARHGAKVAGLMVGDGLLRQDCESYARDNNTPVRFAGFLNQSQIASAYVACDILVLPSDGGETWGLVVNEAMACGRACIVSNRVGSGPDLVTSGETGFIFPVGSVEALASLMVRCAADRPGSVRMGESARDRAARHCPSAAIEGVAQALASVSTKKGAKCA